MGEGRPGSARASGEAELIWRLLLAGGRCRLPPVSTIHIGVKMQINALYVIVKLAERCNLNCSYCYYYTPENISVFDRPSLMKAAHLDDLIGYITDAVQTHGLKRVVFGFHGGEPTLADPATTRRFCRSVRDRIGKICSVGFILQTNGVFLPDDWISLIEEERMGVGISIDGDRSIHDRYRKDHRGRGSYDRVCQNLLRLQEMDEASKIHLTVLAVMGDDFAGVDTYKKLVNDLRVRKIKPLFVDRTADAPMPASDLEKLGKSLCEMFDYWLENDSSRVEVTLFSSIVRELLAKKHDLRGARDRITLGFAFLSDGRVRIQDDFMVADGWFKGQRELNAKSSKFSDYIDQPHMEQLIAGLVASPKACADCKFSDVCAGGEVAHRYRAGHGFEGRSVYCRSLYMLHEHAQRRLELGASYLATQHEAVTAEAG